MHYQNIIVKTTRGAITLQLNTAYK